MKYFLNILQYTNSRNCCIFSCIFSRAKTVDSFTTLAMFNQSSHPKGKTTTAKVFSKPFQSPSHDPFSERPNRSQTTAKIPLSMLLRRKSATLGKLPPFKSQLTQKQAPSQPCLSFSGSEPLTQHLNNSSNFNCNPIFPPEMVKKPSF